MDIQQRILELVEEQGEVTSKQLQEETGVSRQAIHKHIKQLRKAGKIDKIGRTRGVKYVRAGGRVVEHTLERTYDNDDLEEDQVFREIELDLNLENEVNVPAYDVLYYAFTEMLNNAIEHSGSEKIRVTFELKEYDARFVVKDHGIGVFENIRQKFELDSERAALLELMKGKATTDPERHSGEGIFFTSRMADRMELSSHKLELTFDNRRDEIVSGDIHRHGGTQVRFEISRNTRQTPADVFDEYSGEEFDFEFSQTDVRVSLYRPGKEQYVSRSEARRLLQRLDDFQRIELDFEGIGAIGQAFADQVFRVFAERHPEVQIDVKNASEAVEAMIEHVRST